MRPSATMALFQFPAAAASVLSFLPLRSRLGA
jgi:hypothetical protein